jgi:hypothetical protein
MAQGMFVAEVIDDGMAYGKDTAGRLKSVASLLSGGGVVPIGAVEWSTGGDPSLPSVTGIAAPLLPYLGQIPLIGEHVLVFAAFGTDNNSDSAADSYYYIGPIQIDGSKNHNLTQGLFKRTGIPSPSIPKPLIPTYAKKTVNAMQPFFGDTIIQDRNGSCIRMSSTQLPTGFKYMDGTIQGQVPFKSTGVPRAFKTPPLFSPESAGNPIMQITVGLPGQASKSLKKLAGGLGTPSTMIENIDADQSLIYLTSDQRLIYKPTRAFKYNSTFQPNTGDINPSNKLDLHKGAKVFGGNVTTISKYVKRAKDDTENPHHGKIKFTQPNAYPSPNGGRSQIVMRSHRLILDAQLDSILMCALKDVKIGTRNWRIEMDSMMALMEETMKQVAMLAQSCQDLGNGLKVATEINQQVQYPTGVGPTGPCLTFYNDKYTNDVIKKIGSNSVEGTYLYGIQCRIQAMDDILGEFVKMRRSKADKKPEEGSK